MQIHVSRYTGAQLLNIVMPGLVPPPAPSGLTIVWSRALGVGSPGASGH